MNKVFDITAFEELPCNLKKADYVDILLLMCGLKPCARLGCTEITTLREMGKWCKTNRYKYCVSNENYFYISKYKVLVFISMKIDNSTFNHTYILGRLLGYPKCCCKKIKTVGENNIDAWERNFCANTTFIGEFRLIDPVSYTSGSSLISHIPCAPNCEKSLSIAKKTYSVINKYRNRVCFSRWKTWF